MLLLAVGMTIPPAFAADPHGECLISLQLLPKYEFTNGELLTAVLSMQNRAREQTLAAPLRAELRRLGRLKAKQSLTDPLSLTQILLKLKARLGDEKFLQLVGEVTVSHAQAVRSAGEWDDRPHPESREDNDVLDMNRGFGYRLLRENDRAFRDPVYLARMLQSLGADAPGYPGSPVPIVKLFRTAWGKLSPKTEVIDFAITGSDAINQLYPFLMDHAVSRNEAAKDVQLLVFDGSYVGVKGRALEGHEAAFRGTLDPTENELPEKNGAIVSPVTYSLNPSPEEVARLKPLEAKALSDIKARIQGAPKQRPVGGILLEPIVGAAGVFFYRPEFLKQLRALCDRHRVPLIADEVLTGGGRTGKFFAYEHYPDFQPDLVTFGKGLIVAGVARVDRGRKGFLDAKTPKEKYLYLATTIENQPEPLLKATQVLTRIHDDGLMENATAVGEYLLQRMRYHLPPENDATGPRGVGLLLYDPVIMVTGQTAQGRLLPSLDLSKAEVDRFFPLPTEGSWNTLREAMSRDRGYDETKAADGSWSMFYSRGSTIVLKSRSEEEGAATVEPQTWARIYRALAQWRSYVEPEVLAPYVAEAKDWEDFGSRFHDAGWEESVNKRAWTVTYSGRNAQGNPIGVTLLSAHSVNKETKVTAEERRNLLKALSEGESYHQPRAVAAREERLVPQPYELKRLSDAEDTQQIRWVLNDRSWWREEWDGPAVALINPLSGAKILLPPNPTPLTKAQSKAIRKAVENQTGYTHPDVRKLPATKD